MLQDIRFAARTLRKRPGFTAIAGVTLALGIGVTTAVFSLVQGVLLTPPPYRDPQHLVLVPSVRIDSRRVERLEATPAIQWMDWQRQATSFDAIAAYGWSFNFLVNSADGSESFEGMVVTPDYFRVVGVQPMLGRAFVVSDTVPPASVIILGYDVWQRRFNRDPEILGKTIHLSRLNTPPTVIGVMPPGVRFLPSPTASQEPNYNVNADGRFLDARRAKPAAAEAIDVGRRGPPETWRDAGAGSGRARDSRARQAQDDHDLDRSYAEGAVAHGRNEPGRPPHSAAALRRGGARACSSRAAIRPRCCSSAGCSVSRNTPCARRSASDAPRCFVRCRSKALGGLRRRCDWAWPRFRHRERVQGDRRPRDSAPRRRDDRLAAAGVRVWGRVVAQRFSRDSSPRCAPRGSTRWTRSRARGPRSSAGRSERRMLRAVTMIQTALTLALLVGAGLLVRTLHNVANVQSGYSLDRVLTMTVTAVQGDWSDFHHRALERVSRVPGVQQAAFVWGTPLTGNDWPGDGGDRRSSGRQAERPIRAAAALRDARLLCAVWSADRLTDGTSAPRTTQGASRGRRQSGVRRPLFPGRAAVGKKLWFGGRDRPGDRDRRRRRRRAHGRSDAGAVAGDLSVRSGRPSAFSKDLVVRTAADPRTVIAAIRRELRAVDPTVAVERVKTLDEIRTDSLASRIFAQQLLVGFSIVGTLLTVVGVYGVLALSVASRRREIAIRAAIGAHRRDIRNLVLGEGFRLVAGGIVVGIAEALLCRACSSRFCSKWRLPIRSRWPARACCSSPSRWQRAGCRQDGRRQSTHWKH